MQGYLFMFFSLFRQREVSKRELVARFESEQITILKNCAAGLASLKQVLALPSSPFFNHRICVPDSAAIATFMPLPRSLPAGAGRDVRFASPLYLDIATFLVNEKLCVTNRTPRPMPYPYPHHRADMKSAPTG